MEDLALFLGIIVAVVINGIPIAWWLHDRKLTRQAKVNLARMRAELPAALAHFGLVEDEDSSGEWKGEVEGYQVEVEPQDKYTFHVRLKREVECMLSTDKPYSEPEGKMYHFRFRDPRLNKFFRIRYGEHQVVEWLESSDPGLPKLTAFAERMRKEIAIFQIQRDSLNCGLAWGQTRGYTENEEAYLLPEQLDAILPQLLELAREWDRSAPDFAGDEKADLDAGDLAIG